MASQDPAQGARAREREGEEREAPQQATSLERREEQTEQPRRRLQLPAVRVAEEPAEEPRERREDVEHDDLRVRVLPADAARDGARGGDVPLPDRSGQDEDADGSSRRALIGHERGGYE